MIPAYRIYQCPRCLNLTWEGLHCVVLGKLKQYSIFGLTRVPTKDCPLWTKGKPKNVRKYG